MTKADKYKTNEKPDQDYYERIKLKDLFTEEGYLRKEIHNLNSAKENLETKEMTDFLERRLEKIQERIQESGKSDQKKNYFLGIFSYFVRHNPEYIKYLPTKISNDSLSPTKISNDLMSPTKSSIDPSSPTKGLLSPTKIESPTHQI